MTLSCIVCVHVCVCVCARVCARVCVCARACIDTCCVIAMIVNCRYFTSHELHNLFMLDNPWQSTTQERLSQLEDTQSVGYAWLQNHRQFFSSLGK